MEQRPVGVIRLFLQAPKTILLMMSPLLMLLALLGWFILGEAVVVAQKPRPPVALHPS